MPHDPTLNWRAGTVSVGVLDLAISILFEAEFGNTDYSLQLTADQSATLWFSGKAVTGFTINLAAGITGNIRWLAIPYN